MTAYSYARELREIAAFRRRSRWILAAAIGAVYCCALLEGLAR